MMALLALLALVAAACGGADTDVTADLGTEDATGEAGLVDEDATGTEATEGAATATATDDVATTPEGDEGDDGEATIGEDGVLEPLDDGFPSETISIIIGFPPGHLDEQYGRTMIELMEPFSPVDFVLRNQPTGPRLAFDTFDYMETLPNGTTGQVITVASISSMAQRATTALDPDDPASLQDLLDGVIGVTEEHTIVLAVAGESDIQDLEDLVGVAQENPGQLRVATSALGSGVHIPMELLAEELDFSYTPIPNDGVGEAQQLVLGGGAEAVTTVPAQIAPLLESGDLRAIYQWGGERSAIVPDAPTSSELGHPGIQITRGMMTHPDVPPEHIEWLETLLLTAAQQEGYEERLQSLGLERLILTHEEAGEHLQEVFDLTQPVVEELGLASRPGSG